MLENEHKINKKYGQYNGLKKYFKPKSIVVHLIAQNEKIILYEPISLMLKH